MIIPEASRPDFSDVKSGSASAAMPDEVATAKEVTYTVVSGDSLSKIAKKHYGDATKWHAIHEANRDKIKNPDLIQVGWVLKLPQL